MLKVTKSARVAQLYMLNLALLATHEIDSAYWHEWEMFHLPGGIQAFLILNLLALMLFIVGLKHVILKTPNASMFSYFLAGAGLFAAVVHAGFIGAGYPQFRNPVSQGLLVAILLVSIAQIVVQRRAIAEFRK